jgi:hypothetical protein
MTLTLQVALQGRGAAPSARWAVPIAVVLTDPSDGPVRYTYDVTCDAQGQAGPVTVDYNWDDPSVTATPTATPDPSSTMTLTLWVTLQGRGAAPFTIVDIPQGVYDVRAHRPTSLVNVCRARSLGPGTHVLNMGTLLEGDMNQDGSINIFDFALLASAYGTGNGEPGYDGRADLNGDERVDIFDFALLASNYGATGPLEVSGN